VAGSEGSVREGEGVEEEWGNDVFTASGPIVLGPRTSSEVTEERGSGRKRRGRKTKVKLFGADLG